MVSSPLGLLGLEEVKRPRTDAGPVQEQRWEELSFLALPPLMFNKLNRTITFRDQGKSMISRLEQEMYKMNLE